jgi:poly-gamma-glutamate capsule biosynthesis protein CapA/YwtB (metallophosphatase superfamily)
LLPNSCSVIPRDSWIADEETPGIAPLKPEYYDRLLDTIEKADSECDVLIILLHWGTEYVDLPETWQTEIAQKMIDRGADAIVGHHSHVLQGIVFYNNKPILYSIGNFVFLKKNDKAGHSAIFSMKFNKEGFMEGSIQPVNIKYCKANLLPATDELRDKIIQHVGRLSKERGTMMDADGKF